MATRYSVFCTPLIGEDLYGTEIDITDRVINNGLKTIKRSIDSEDYDVGTFTFDDLEIKALNSNGYFNDVTDGRSIFKFKRDLAKVRVVAENDANGDVIAYRGLINEEATKLDVSKEEISFRVLSRDSVLRKTKISGGSISSGSLFSSTFLAIFNDPTIASVLTLVAGNIDLPYDATIDDGSTFDNISARDALNKLLVASGAVILIDGNGNVSIRDRAANSATSILNLYGPYDIQRRQNTHQLKEYNPGLHRMYNSVTINEHEENNSAYVQTFGFRGRTFDLPFITDEDKLSTIANTVLEEFKAPKVECIVEVPISVSRGVELLDRVSLNWPLRITPYSDGLFLPIIGCTKIGEAAMPLPNTYGSLSVDPRISFKVIEIQEDPNKFSAFLKLRQIGNSIEDGYFTDDLTGIVGFAVIGVSFIGGVGDPDGLWNPSVIGAALIGSTEVA